MGGCASDHSEWIEDAERMQDHAASATGHFILEIVSAAGASSVLAGLLRSIRLA